MGKNDIRKQLLKRRDALDEKERFTYSRQICRRLSGLEAVRNAKAILMYAPIKSEVQATLLLENPFIAGKQLFFPRVLGKEMHFYRVNSTKELRPGSFGVPEPEADEQNIWKPEREQTVILVPGAGFDRTRSRIGYGAGFYDRFFAGLPPEIIFRNPKVRLSDRALLKIGLAYSCQIEEHFQTEPTDISVDLIVTEEELI